jgi:iron complex transport system ATP-binding protein
VRLEIAGLTFVAGGRAILDGASLALDSGELVGLIGPNGAGKSILLRAALGLVPAAGGRVTLDGADFRAMTARARARTVAYLPQDRRVEWRLNVWQIVALGRYPHRAAFGGATPSDRDATEAALEAVDAAHLADLPFAVLSGGERTRVLLARALAVRAPLLLADEPAAALDAYHQLQIMELLRERATAGTGVLVVLHDLSMAARFMDRVALMDRGRIVAMGAPADVLTPDIVRTVYNVSIVTGEQDGEPFLAPWRRI